MQHEIITRAPPINFPYHKYRIEWSDIASDSGWASDKEFDRMKLAMPVSEGWLYEKNKKVIKIFASYDTDDDGIQFGERTIIPTSCVKKMTRLDEAEFGVDDISEEEYNKLKEESMAKKKKKIVKKKKKNKKKKKR